MKKVADTQVDVNMPRILPASGLLLTRKEEDYFYALEKYNAPWLYERLLEKKEVKSYAEFVERFNEFKKYIALIYLSGKPLGMVSNTIDAVWHEFILFTREYMQFCDQFCK